MFEHAWDLCPVEVLTGLPVLGVAIPIVLEDAELLAAFTHPNHLLLVGSWGFAQLPPTCIFNSNRYIPIVLEDAELLAAFTHPNHLLLVGSWGFAQLPPTCIFNSNRYIPIVLEDAELLAAFTHPNHLLLVGSWGFAQLPPTCISNSNRYKSKLCGSYDILAEEKGSQAVLLHNKEEIGRVVRARTGIKPVYVSLGHRITLTTAVRYVQACLTRYRLPEAIRWADALASNRGQTVAKAQEILGR